jgi:competence protein ComGF
MNDIELNNRIKKIDKEQILKLFEFNRKPELNNVIEKIKIESYSILTHNEKNIESYDLILIVNYNELTGYAFTSSRELKDRDLLTYQFCRFLSDEFKNLNEIILFNTFQDILKSTYEMFGFFCMNQYQLEELNNPLFILKNKKSVEQILTIEPVSFFKQIFNKKKTVENIEGIEKIYLFYDLNDNLFKVGNTKKTIEVRIKGVSEPTKKGKKPETYLISAWNASAKIEKEIHEEFKLKRKRGEWFDLNVRDLDKLNSNMKEYEMIKYYS